MLPDPSAAAPAPAQPSAIPQPGGKPAPLRVLPRAGGHLFRAVYALPEAVAGGRACRSPQLPVVQLKAGSGAEAQEKAAAFAERLQRFVTKEDVRCPHAECGREVERCIKMGKKVYLKHKTPGPTCVLWSGPIPPAWRRG